MYVLKHFDTPLIRFEVLENLATPVVRIAWMDEERRHLRPLGMRPTDDGLASWLKRRAIPRNRAFVHALLAKCGLSLNRPMDIIFVCKGLSLNDSYWVTNEGNRQTFDDVNLYDNRFSKVLAGIVFTGYGTGTRTSLASSPEFTTNGMLPKCWRRIDGRISLFKGGTTGASNTGCEPYSEYYAMQVAEALGVSHVPYTIKRWNGSLCSVCGLFTSKRVSFVPVGSLVTSGGFEAVSDYYSEAGFDDAFTDMLILDAIICNVDRHYGNFGFLVDSPSNRIMHPAPLFDHGNSLFNFAGNENFKDLPTLNAYIDTLRPCTYDDFVTASVDRLTPRHKERIRGLLSFTFRKHPRYNYDTRRLRLMSLAVRERARRLL